MVNFPSSNKEGIVPENVNGEVLTGSIEVDKNRKRTENLEWILRRHASKILIFIPLMLFNIYAILFYTGFVTVLPIEPDDTVFEQIVLNQCQFLDKRKLEGNEGTFDEKNNLKLKSVLVVVTNGDRYSFSNEKGIECQKSAELEKSEMARYDNSRNKLNLSALLDIDEQLRTLKTTPESPNCTQGSLTPRGALQHYQLGKFIAEKYIKTSLFDSTPLLINSTSSSNHRYFASAVAFLSGFLESTDLKSISVPIPIISDTSSYTQCSYFEKIQKLLEKEMSSLFRLEADSSIRNASEFLREKIGGKLQDVFEVVQETYSNFVCSGVPLPCDKHQCVDFKTFDKICKYSMRRDEKVYENDFGLYRKFHSLLVHPVLENLKQQIQTNNTDFHVISSNSSVLSSLLELFGIKTTDYPYYSARLVFEFYESPRSNQLSVRILYDGVDRTKDVRFCEEIDSNGLCNSSNFLDFIDRGFFELSNSKNFTEICNI